MNELLQLMHDTMNKTGTIKRCASYLKEKKDISPEDFNRMLDAIYSRAEDLEIVLDHYYEQKKKGGCNESR